MVGLRPLEARILVRVQASQLWEQNYNGPARAGSRCGGIGHCPLEASILVRVQVPQHGSAQFRG